MACFSSQDYKNTQSLRMRVMFNISHGDYQSHKKKLGDQDLQKYFLNTDGGF